MTEKKVERIDGAELRLRAEQRLLKKKGTAQLPGTEAEQSRLMHELQVHQIELEMQNAELRQARDEVEELLGKCTDFYDNAPVGYITLDRNGTIRTANLTGADLIGVERSRLIGRRFEHLIASDNRAAFLAFIGKVFTSPAKEACEAALLTGRNSPPFVQIEAVAAASGLECRLALIDITERRRVEEALRQEKETVEVFRQEKEAAEATARSKSKFLANMSHELRTPMTGILGMLQLALEEDITPKPRGYLETTLSSARSLLRIINDILDMAKIEAGKLTIEEKPFSIPWCIAESVNVISSEACRKGVDLTFSVAEGTPELVVGDQVRLRQILLNLIGNAVKFTSEGKVEVRISASGTVSAGKREFTFTVTDSGIGIPADKKGLLFRAFSQADDSHSRSFGGTGLGLVISREIAELMGGTISFESKEGTGSIFSCTIPLGNAGLEADALTRPGSLSPETTDDAPEREWNPRLLLAEDDPVTRQVLGLMFEKLNYHLEYAENGLKAVEMWGKGRYDLVLMDVQMPRLDGFEATRAIREKERERGGHTPIVAMTAHAFKDDENKCLAAGMDAYITKPVDFKKTLQVIENIIKKKFRGSVDRENSCN